MKPLNCYRFRGNFGDLEMGDHIRSFFKWSTVTHRDREKVWFKSFDVQYQLPSFWEFNEGFHLWPLWVVFWLFMYSVVKRRRWIYRPYPAEGPW